MQAEDTGGEVGLNWSLQGGLGIHRQVRDLPDDIQVIGSLESRYGWLRYPASTSSPANRIAQVPNAPAAFNATTCTTTEQNVATLLLGFGELNHKAGTSYNLYDTEPDIFTYSVPGYSGKFVFDGTGAVRLLPYAPIQITPLFTSQVQAVNCAYPVSTGELTGFIIRTAEGTVYTFNVTERISQQTYSTAPYGGTKFLLRHYWDFKINQYISGTSNQGPSELYYTTGWLVSSIKTPAAATNASANTITFGYDCVMHTPKPEVTGNLFQLGSPPTGPSTDHTLGTIVKSSPKLISITTATAVVTLNRELDELDDFHLSSLVVTSPTAEDGLIKTSLIKSYEFEYLGQGRYLARILLKRSASTLPLYAFSYATEVDAGGALPKSNREKTGLNQDYWGFANNNRASTGIPRLYVYPQLLSAASPRPAAPYRLYPAPAYENGGTVLAGADRRPANRLSVAVAGTLTGVTFATGGQVALEYEQNQFYDPVAQQSLPAGGLRLRTLKVKDPVTRVETRRDYSYQQAGTGTTGISSGVLLHLPRYAFAVPVTNSTSWADVTVRTVQEVAPDPFEGRVVGYQQVTEAVPGKGLVTTTFAVPGAADDNTSPGEDEDRTQLASQLLPAWQRPVFGVARQLSNGSCPSVAPLQAVGELYPFAPAPNYDFCRGVPLKVQYRAEPSTGPGPGPLVREETFTYQYVNARPGLSPVTGLRYEQLGDLSQTILAYAKYTLLTDYFYRPRQEVSTQFIAGGTNSQSSVGYRYNNQGWVAAKTLLGSDNVVTRTRYKYLSDYALPASGATGELLAMSTRIGEGISADPVEIISEIRPAGSTGHVAYAGATLQTFTTGTVLAANNQPVTTPTYPYQLRRWQPNQSVAGYDSVMIVGNALHIPTAMRVASTVLEVDANLNPLSVQAAAGRQVLGKHLGYGGLVPLLQVANAQASEVIFSDFETTDKPYSFIPLIGTSYGPPTASTTAAHTGTQGCVLPAGSSQTTALPASTAAQYRLVFWARATAAATGSVTVQPAITPAIAFSFTCTTQWQRFELLLPLGNLTNRPSYQLAITAAGSNSVGIQLDDILLVPTTAAVASTTYNLTTGKTSETDARGRTTYYEYAPTGDLALVRDHNQAIEHQYQKVLPGQTLQSGISFNATGTMVEQTPITFTALANLNGQLQYKWDFGNGPIITTTSPQTTHSYPITGLSQEYTVRLTVSSQGVDYLYVEKVYIAPVSLEVTTCMAGIVSIDDCKKGSSAATVDVDCNPTVPQTSTTFQVTANLSGVAYQWQFYDSSQIYNPDWVALPANSIIGGSPTTSTIVVAGVTRLRFRCRVSINLQEVTSTEFKIDHFQSTLNCP